MVRLGRSIQKKAAGTENLGVFTVILFTYNLTWSYLYTLQHMGGAVSEYLTQQHYKTLYVVGQNLRLSSLYI